MAVKDSADAIAGLSEEPGRVDRALSLQLLKERDALQARVKELEWANNVYSTQTEELESRATRLQQERDEAYERAARTAHTWSIASNIRLHAGEMSAQEMRTAQAIACGIEAAIRRLAGPEKA